MNEQDALQILQKNRDEILLFEISALIHDLGKLSKEFVGGKAEESTRPGNLVNIDHNLILLRLTYCEDPYYTEVGLTQADALSWYQKSIDVTAIQRKILKELLNGSYKTDGDHIGGSLSQAAIQVIGADFSSNSDYKALRKFRREFSDQIKSEQKVPSDFWNDKSEKLRQLLSKELNVSLQINTNKWLELKALGDVLEQHHPGTLYKELNNAVLIMKVSDGVDSGIDKGATAKEVSKQSYDKTFISSAFGYETFDQKIDLSDLSCIRNNYAYELGIILEKVREKRQNQETITPKEWMEFLDNSNGIRKITEEAFREGLGETRRAANDVTLWDHSYSVASLYKTAVVKCLLDGEFKEPAEIKWRILRISFDGLAFIQKAHHIPDILGRQEFLNTELDNIKNVLEIEYPLGNEIYRDENGSAFIVPALEKDDDGNRIREFVQEALEDSKSQINFSGELIPKFRISKASRGATNLGILLSETLEPPQPSIRQVREWWDGQNEEICTVCQLRPMGYGEPSDDHCKAKKRSVCCICLNRREKRSEKWVTKELDKTIWVDEVADQNGRVALVVGKFDLSHWLDGYWLNSIFAKNPRDGQQINNSDIKKRDIRGLIENATTDELKEQIEVLLSVRKHPSFARLRRIWETTSQFWQDVNEKLIPTIIQPAQFRLEIIPNSKFNLGRYHTYDARIGNTEISLVWDSANNKFISADNLLYVAKLLELKACKIGFEQPIVKALKDKLEKQNFLKIYEKPGTGKPVEEVETLKTFNVNTVIHNYRPFIPIMCEPQIYLGLVPANKAIHIANKMRHEYELQFSKVRNRLPLHLSLIFFNRRLPVYVAIDAARRMLNRESKLEVWEVKDSPEVIQIKDELHGTPRFKMNISLAHTNEGNEEIQKEVNQTISYSCGDPSEKDYYHPYFYVEKLNDSKDETQRVHRFKSPLPDKPDEFKNLLHVSELIQGDKVYLMPSTFDFEFLDVVGRRFEINYSQNGKRPNSSRPFLLEDIKKIKQIWELIGGTDGLTITQISQIERLIEVHREDWFTGNKSSEWINDETFRRFVDYTLRRAGDDWWTKLSADEQILLSKWAINGRLTDVLELFMKIMKEKPLKRE